MESKKQLELLELELQLIQESIKRVKQFLKEDEKKVYRQYSSHVVGELKHRLIAFKQRCVIINKISTYDLTHNK